MSGPVDQLDAQIIGLLADEPRIGLMEVARRLQVARGTVQARLAKLTERGIVRGFGPELDPHRMGYPLMAFVQLQITQSNNVTIACEFTASPGAGRAAALSDLTPGNMQAMQIGVLIAAHAVAAPTVGDFAVEIEAQNDPVAFVGFAQ